MRASRTERPTHPPLVSILIGALLLAALDVRAAAAQQRARDVISSQPAATSQSVRAAHLGLTLTDLQPAQHVWFVLRVAPDGDVLRSWHLENARPGRQRIGLEAGFAGLVLREGDETVRCALWASTTPSALQAAAAAGQPWALLCDERVLVRFTTEGHKSTKEWATDLLRRHVWGGERITTFIRETVYQDAYRQVSAVAESAAPARAERSRPEGAPPPAAILPEHDGRLLEPAGLGLALERTPDGNLVAGRWYRVEGSKGIWVSAVEPRLVPPPAAEADRRRLRALDEVEASALVYVVAFDLDRFDLGWEIGTEHPGVGWSERVREEVRRPDLAGPDGFADLAPLARTGMLSPATVETTVATFTGGFKRYHGAFKWGELAFSRGGHHYGFVEHGTVLSTLEPGLATVLVLDDGRVELVTWRDEDAARLARVRHARQNGVPLVEPDPTTGGARVGALVAEPSKGNWSGSQDGRYRTLRAGLCLREEGERRHLLYGYFSSANPSAMARVFLAYGCSYAMLTDMNALEHTYLALYRTQGASFRVQHLIDEMSVLDKQTAGQLVPRFVGYADNRDFFYLTRKPGVPR